MFNLDPCMDPAEFHRKELRLSASCPLKVKAVRDYPCDTTFRYKVHELLTFNAREKTLHYMKPFNLSKSNTEL